MSRRAGLVQTLRLRSIFTRQSPGAVGTIWGIADQALSSLTNFLLAIAIARQVSQVDFGAFALAFGVYVIALNVARAVCTDPLTIRYSGASPEQWKRATSSATGLAFALGVTGLVACLAVGLVLRGEVGDAIVALGIGLPVLLAQDAWRFAFFAARRGAEAFVNDLVWAVVLCGALIAVSLSGTDDVEAYILAWAVGGGAGALYGIRQAGVVPDPRRSLAWLREHLDIGPRLAAEAAASGGALPATLAAVGIVANVAAAGAVRAGQVLTNALHVATFGVAMAAVPEAVRLVRRSPGALIRLCLVVGFGLGVVTVLWGATLLALPPFIGRAFLGASWEPARQVILPLTVGATAASIQTGAIIGLRALAMTDRSLRARLLSSMLFIVGGVSGAVLGGPVGTAWGLAVGLIVSTILWWMELLRGSAVAIAGAIPPEPQGVTADTTNVGALVGALEPPTDR